ncbi:hypothetical protein PMAYCL1PPCAC_32987, partial [Pristionchus mayeri]
RYSRARKVQEMFVPAVAVFYAEILKLLICLIIESKTVGFTKLTSSIRSHIIYQPLDTLKVCVPAIVYVVQNNLFYVSASHLEAGTFMIFSQLKIFTTAIFSIIMLGRSLSGRQWAGLVVLFIGVSLVQVDATTQTEIGNDENPLIGLTSIVIACVLSGFAGVYLEKILKGSVSIWMRNIQLAIFAVPSSFASIYAQKADIGMPHVLSYGFDAVVWLTVFWFGIGGLSMAACIKYADNIAKNFATAISIVLTTIGSVIIGSVIFSFIPSSYFIMGAILVMLSIFLYSSSKS